MSNSLTPLKRKRVDPSNSHQSSHSTTNTASVQPPVKRICLRKHNGSAKRGTYGPGKPHAKSYLNQSISKQQEINKLFPWWVVDLSAKTGYCSACRRKGTSLALRYDTCLYQLASSRKKLKEHDQKKLHKEAIDYEKFLKDYKNPQKMDVSLKRNQKK